MLNFPHTLDDLRQFILHFEQETEEVLRQLRQQACNEKQFFRA